MSTSSGTFLDYHWNPEPVPQRNVYAKGSCALPMEGVRSLIKWQFLKKKFDWSVPLSEKHTHPAQIFNLTVSQWVNGPLPWLYTSVYCRDPNLQMYSNSGDETLNPVNFVICRGIVFIFSKSMHPDQDNAPANKTLSSTWFYINILLKKSILSIMTSTPNWGETFLQVLQMQENLIDGKTRSNWFE